MKKIIFYLLTVVISMGAVAQTRKVAILDAVDLENSLSYGIKLMIRGQLAEAVTNTPGYEAYDRTNLQQIFDEQEFQRTGLVSDADIKKIGEMTGVQYVLVAEVGKIDANTIVIDAKILNVETARVAKSANVMTQLDVSSLQKGAQELASRLLASIRPQETIKTALGFYSDRQYIELISANEYSIDGMIVDRKTYYDFIKHNRQVCPIAYQEYKKGNDMTIAGWCLFSTGAAVTAVGAVSVECMIIGPCMMCGAGIPLLSVGYYKKHYAYRKYNEHCAPKKKDAISLNLQASGNGLGLALHF